jgi:hypothetical protein
MLAIIYYTVASYPVGYGCNYPCMNDKWYMLPLLLCCQVHFSTSCRLSGYQLPYLYNTIISDNGLFVNRFI